MLKHPWLELDSAKHAADSPLGATLVQRLQRFQTYDKFKQARRGPAWRARAQAAGSFPQYRSPVQMQRPHLHVSCLTSLLIPFWRVPTAVHHRSLALPLVMVTIEVVYFCHRNYRGKLEC